MHRPAMLLALFLLVPACAPMTVSVTLFADKSRLYEAPIEQDKKPEGTIVLIDVRGLLADRSPSAFLGPRTNPVDELIARLRKAENDPAVSAIILRINSPGGTVTASEVMYREVRRFRETSGKPVVASLGEVAASGGYYIALAADRIVAEPTCITGSIGVIIPTVNFSEGLGRIGIRSRSVVSGDNKDVGNPLEPPNEQHFAILQGMVDEFYAEFRALVIERRGEAHGAGGENGSTAEVRTLDMARLDQLTDGRILTGRQALGAGLVDQVGGISQAFETTKKLADLEGARLVKYYREDAEVPRSAYAPTSSTPVPPGGTEINLLQIRADSPFGLGGLESSGIYYLWVPPG